MKKQISIILILISISCTIIAAVSPSRVQNEMPETENLEKPITETETETINELTAFILDIHLSTGTLIVAENFDAPTTEQTRVILKKNTELLIHGTTSSLEDLAVGNQVSITYKGDLVKSDTNLMHYPLQIEMNDSHAKIYTERACILSINYDDHSFLIGPSKDATPEEQKRIYIMDSTHFIGHSSLILFHAGEWISITYSDALDDNTAVQISTNVYLEPDDTLKVPVTITQYILDIDDSFPYLMVGPTLDTDYYSQTQVIISTKTSIYANDTPIILADLAIGNKVCITWGGSILESSPPQISGVSKIEVVE